MAEIDVKIELIAQQALATLQKLEKNSKVTADALDKLSNNSKRAQKNTKDIPKGADSAARSFNRLGKSVKQTSIAMEVFRGITGAQLFFRFGRALKEGVVKAVRDFVEFEDALVGVGKTTNLEGIKLQKLGEDIQKLAFRIPVATNELLKLAQISAQLGVTGRNNLLKFTETAARLAVSTDVSGEEAASSLARIITATGGTVESVDKLGASLVALGNTFNATESEILTASTEIARSTAGFGIAAQDVLGIAAGLKSVGIQAESGGSQIGLFFNKLDSALVTGGEQLQAFEEILGLTGDQIREQLGKDPVELLIRFAEGLENTNTSAGKLTTALKNVGLQNIRAQKTFRPLTQATEQFREAVESSRIEYEKNAALVEESDRKFATTKATLDRFKTSIDQLFTAFGKLASGPFRGIVAELTEMARATKEAIDPSLETKLLKSGLKTKQLSAEFNSLGKEFEALSKTEFSIFQVGQNLAKNERLNEIKVRQKEIGREINNELLRQINLEEQIAEKKEIESGKTGGTGGGKVIADAKSRAETLRQLTNEINQQNLDDLTILAEQEAMIKDEGAQASIDREFRRIELEHQLRIQDVENSKKTQEEKNLALAKADADALAQRQKAARASLKFDQNIEDAKVNIRRGAFGLLAALAKDGSKEQFVIQKAAALAEIAIADGKARALIPAQTAFIPYPANLAAAAQMNALVTAQTSLGVATVIASAIKGFQDGGVVGGTSTSGDNVLARVNSGEMILNRAQQSNLFDIANGKGGGESKEIVVHTTVELDGEAVGKSVSRQVANGLELGEVV